MKSKYILNSLVYVFLLIIFFSLISCKQHTHEWILSSVYTPSSCISTGKGQFTCNTCEETKVDVIPAKGHKEEIDKSVEPTCVSSGLTEGKHCYYCKYVIEEQQNISALGHNFENDICTRCNINYLHSLFTFSLNQNRGGYYITSYNGTESNLNIPTTYSNLPIVGIDKQAFSGNSFLENVTIPDSILTIGNNAFDNCTLLKNITFGSNVTSIGDMAFYGCYSLESIIIPNSVSSIGNSVFECCTSLKNVILGTGLNSISSFAFRNCTSLKNIVIPSNITVIGKYAFEECVSLDSVIMHNSIIEIKNGAFCACTSLKSFIIPDGITKIEQGVFFQCTSLEEITIPISINTIDLGAFDECYSLINIYYLGSKAQWNNICINSYNEPLNSVNIICNIQD